MNSGLLLVNKPLYKTSHDIVSAVRRCLKIKKTGHFGTLDPLAEGLLLIAIGRTTRFFDFYLKKKKTYTGEIRFGYSTTTYDREGERNSDVSIVDLSAFDIKKITAGFIGKQEQTPPIYSAKKYNGKALYKYAREEKEVEIKPAEIEIYSFITKIIDKNTLWFEVEVSSGTYIRSIAYDFGQKLGVGAFLNKLTRTKIGEFSLNNAVDYGMFDDERCKEIEQKIIKFNNLLPDFSEIKVTSEGRNYILNGREIDEKHIVGQIINKVSDKFKIIDEEGKILAIARKDDEIYKPFMVFN